MFVFIFILDLNRKKSINNIFIKKSETNSLSHDESFFSFNVDDHTEFSDNSHLSFIKKLHEPKASKSQSLSCEPVFDECVFENYSNLNTNLNSNSNVTSLQSLDKKFCKNFSLSQINSQIN